MEPDPQELIRRLLAEPARRVHLVGICGVGMAGLAVLLKARGFEVSGCDEAPNRLAGFLRAHGIAVVAGHDRAHLAAAPRWVIRSAAVNVREDELAAAREAGLPVVSRGRVLPCLLEGLRSVVVTGTHGKTTTTAWIAQALRGAGRDVAHFVGGEVDALGGVAGGGGRDGIVVEGDESDGTIAFYHPDIAVVTNIEFDHMEHFDSVESFRQCFRALIANTRESVVYCADDPAARELCGDLPRGRSYGLAEGAWLRGTAFGQDADGCHFEVFRAGEPLGRLALPAPGEHNARNALAVTAVLLQFGVEFAVIARELARVELPRRRLETVAQSGGVRVISDYAHHPTEVRAFLRAAALRPHARRLAVYQPHRYSRTLALGREFPAAFEGVDELILLPVYAASEEPVAGGTIWDLYGHFREQTNQRVIVAGSIDRAWAYLRTILREGDLLLVIGAGSVEQLAEHARRELGEGGSAALNPAAAWLRQVAGLGLGSATVRANEPFGAKTTWKVGGAADLMVDVTELADLERLAGWARGAGVPLRVIGAGSNVLVSDLGVRGLVVRLIGGCFREIRREDDLIVAGAGTSNRKLLAWCGKHGLGGLEFLEGVPGTVGGAVRMNAGAWGGETGAFVRWVRALTVEGKVVCLRADELGFAYRRCPALDDKIVLEAAFQLARCTPEESRERRRSIAERRGWWKEVHSAGSVFKNPAGQQAGALIDRAGLKGYRIGGARFYEAHANVIATQEGARASDVQALMEKARVTVRDKFGVELEPEVILAE